ncbi:DUF6460 domain-containing protein [Cohaesibacter celericrescens]|uniref:DUF6460 domain-containing protein n=1 Tax=Cohaesibacter celericrescens TaxID=2067669 RepID=A0A2N5XK26_9HYPH|nr:DUF6460 domain-containing protein [Cohaesibacter celericrescens]PLW74871.1 hypothetical protein C0081_21380 [Cohaesibacter celericrescens]
MDKTNMTRFFGGSPGPVVLRLIGLSVVVGVILSALNLHPRQVLNHIVSMFEHIYYMGFDAVQWALEYFLLGALIVFPIWLVMRVLKIGRKEP